MIVTTANTQTPENDLRRRTEPPAHDVAFSIILINFNSAGYVRPCLEALRKQRFDGAVEIIVVNHLATDGSLDILKQQRDILLIDPGRNLGFSGGNNLGIRRSFGKYILCLNFDCFVTEDFLQKIYDAFESRPEVGMISGKLRKMVDQEPTGHLDSTGIDFTSLIAADRGEWESDRGQYDHQSDIFGPSGAAGCYRKEALEDIVYKDRQYFDEQMFVYCEDIDLAWRLNLAGWRGLHVPEALAYHERGATRKQSLWKKIQYYRIEFCNRYFTILKNLRVAEDLRGRFKALHVQEFRSARSLCRKSLARWLVALTILGRLARLTFRPSFIAKRRLAHRNGAAKGRHLDLGFGTDHQAR